MEMPLSALRSPWTPDRVRKDKLPPRIELQTLQAGRLLEDKLELNSGIANTGEPTGAPLTRLKMPLQKVHDKPREETLDLPPVAFSHVGDFLCNVRNVGLRKTPLP
jgi:hypothetical protein